MCFYIVSNKTVGCSLGEIAEECNMCSKLICQNKMIIISQNDRAIKIYSLFKKRDLLVFLKNRSKQFGV